MSVVNYKTTQEQHSNMDEINNDKIIQQEADSVEMPQNDFINMTNIKENVRFLISQSSAPTFVPRTPLEHFFLYNNAGTRRLYVYDKTSGTWHFSSLT